MEYLPKLLILTVARTVAYKHTGDISINDFLLKMFWVLWVKGFAPVLLVHLVLEVCWDLDHLGGNVVRWFVLDCRLLLLLVTVDVKSKADALIIEYCVVVVT